MVADRFQDATGKAVSVVNASSGEIFAGSPQSPQTEATPISPTSPYGASKALGHMMCQIYRSRGVQAANAILYNHESPRRPATFVTRKITNAVAAIVVGRQQRFTLGDMTVRRDWGWAPDYVDAMYRIARNGTGQDFVIATGIARSIAEFVAAAFAAVGIETGGLTLTAKSHCFGPPTAPKWSAMPVRLKPSWVGDQPCRSINSSPPWCTAIWKRSNTCERAPRAASSGVGAASARRTPVCAEAEIGAGSSMPDSATPRGYRWAGPSSRPRLAVFTGALAFPNLGFVFRARR